jgi:hypothetical protein
MGLRDKLRKDAAQYLRPGEQIQAVFLARRPSSQANDRAVIATDQRLLLLKLSFLGRSTAPLGEAPRVTRLGPCVGLMKTLDAFGAPLAVSFRFFKDIDDADRAVGWQADSSPAAREDGGEVVRVPSYAWKMAALPLLVMGWIATTLAVVAVMQIDGAAAAANFTPSQDAVGLTALVVGVTGAVGVAVVAVRWWRRPAVTITPKAVTIYGAHQVSIPWPMIGELVGGPGTGRGDHAGVVLTGGRLIEAPALRRLRQPVSRPETAPPAAAVGHPESVTRARIAPSPPGQALVEVQLPFPWSSFRWLVLLPLFFGFLVMFPDGNGGAQSGIDVGGAVVVALCFEVVAAASILCCWLTLTRTMILGSGWLAWRPRLDQQWRVLPLAELVSTIDSQWPRRSGVRLSRADGSGLRIRNAELAAGLAGPLGRQIAEHPAATPDFLAALQAHVLVAAR